MRREYCFYVYIMQSASRRVLYIGMTNNLHKRVFQHKTHAFEGFTDDYNAIRLVYWESFDDVRNAIDREKQLKRWRREKKIRLVERKNPAWRDLAADWNARSLDCGACSPRERASSLGMTQLVHCGRYISKFAVHLQIVKMLFSRLSSRAKGNDSRRNRSL